MRIPQQQQQRAAAPPRGHSPAPGTSAMHKPAAQCEKRKESVSPPPERERDIPPKLPSSVYDPMLHCHYRIGEYLGKGGFAWCYTAIHDQTGYTYALKVIAKFRLRKAHHREKVMREIAIHKELKHANVVRMYSSFEDEDNVYMVLELCKLKSLVNIVRARGRLTEPEAAHYLRQLMFAVVYLHEQMDVLHRDLKLGNMLLASDMTIKLADFGLASTFEQIKRVFDEKGSVSICGTPNYIAPEVLQRRGHSKATEAWAMGCVLYAMLVGRPPFETEQLEETYLRIQECKYSIPSDILLSPSARDLIFRLLHPDPNSRPMANEVLMHPFISQYRNVKMAPEFCVRAPNEFDLLSSTSRPPVPSPIRSLTPGTANRPSRPKQRESSSSTPNPERRRMACPSSSNELLWMPPSVPVAPLATVEDVVGTPSPVETFERKFLDKCRLADQRPVASGTRGSTSSTGSGDSGLGSDPRPSHLDLDLLQLFTRYARVLATVTDVNNNCDQRVSIMPASESDCVLFVVKWIDYTNKYGFGCQLSDGTRCVLFNDGSALSISSTQTLYQHNPTPMQPEKAKYWLAKDGCPRQLREYVELANMFGEYMDRNLIQGGDAVHNSLGMQLPSLLYFRRNDNYVTMVLSDGTVQVNFFKEHVKMVIGAGQTDDTLSITIINPQRRAYTSVLRECKRGVDVPGGQYLFSSPYRDLVAQVCALIKQERDRLRPTAVAREEFLSTMWTTEC